ncbi:hypothetical protein P691DRAFT_658159 [Macrolepiota fuliginosa MF-IS2]|uniref:Transmembrane protein n=1 Tax=Macrolepiota fuliginosa MF-IS2 TaxID=1400762 RepID=A0A9P5XPT7_9AGAR|nr:hypothetical protein P691DRAFT_658159 [Macrolepiota fuliginosa MF-IS2]
MSNGSPSAYLLWAILSCIFLAFLILHLWAYDHFNCLRWGAGRQPGAFKRVMTYSYLGTLPLLVVFSVATTAIKFSEGTLITTLVIPKPFARWKPENRHWLLPLYFILSTAWSLELVTHLEELTFWLFLLHQGPGKRGWFYSWEFRACWIAGSIVAVVGMPLTTLLTRHVLETCQAYIFLVGSSAGTTTTICFLYVLFHFPAFIKHVKAEGAEPDVVVRLTTFYQLNRIRVMFRFLFTIPLFIIAVDGVHPPYSVVTNSFALDFLLMMGGIGCFVSSAITLLIFFPRSFAHEAGYKSKIQTPLNSSNVASASTPTQYHRGTVPCSPKHLLSMNHATSLPAHRLHQFRFPDYAQNETIVYSRGGSIAQFPESRQSLDSALSPGYETDTESEVVTAHTIPAPSSADEHQTSQSRVDPGWERQGAAVSTDDHTRIPQVYPAQHGVYATTSLPPRPRPTFRDVRSSLPLHPYVSFVLCFPLTL